MCARVCVPVACWLLWAFCVWPCVNAWGQIPPEGGHKEGRAGGLYVCLAVCVVGGLLCAVGGSCVCCVLWVAVA